MAAFRAEQEAISRERPAPPPLESVLPRGSNLLRSRTPGLRTEQPTNAPVSAGSEGDDAPAAGEGEAYDAEEAPWPTEADGVFQDDSSAPTPVIAPAATTAKAKRGEPVSGAVPAMDELKARLNPQELQLLEELFRARFVSTKRIPEGWLKT